MGNYFKLKNIHFYKNVHECFYHILTADLKKALSLRIRTIERHLDM